MPKQPNPNKPTELDPIPIVLPPFSVSEDQDFALEIVVTGKSKTIVHPDDSFLFLSPGQKATLTNLDDPSKTVTFGVTGSFHQTTLDDGTVVTESHGRSLLFDPLIDDGKPGLVLAIGNFSFAFDAEGDLIEPLNGDGQIVNVIDLLV